ncbi:MAG: 30S ribosomal protein S9 [Deltaproteobacteria bacterium]
MDTSISKPQTLGRRKNAIARISLVPGKGLMTVNGRPVEEYFKRETDLILVRQPLKTTNTFTKYDCQATVSGGGITGQAGAIRLAISRQLINLEPELKDLLRKSGFLTRDPRAKERKKYGQKGARKRFQWTKR